VIIGSRGEKGEREREGRREREGVSRSVGSFLSFVGM